MHLIAAFVIVAAPGPGAGNAVAPAPSGMRLMAFAGSDPLPDALIVWVETGGIWVTESVDASDPTAKPRRVIPLEDGRVPAMCVGKKPKQHLTISRIAEDSLPLVASE